MMDTSESLWLVWSVVGITTPMEFTMSQGKGQEGTLAIDSQAIKKHVRCRE